VKESAREKKERKKEFMENKVRQSSSSPTSRFSLSTKFPL
jgi:hypothetical protein